MILRCRPKRQIRDDETSSVKPDLQSVLDICEASLSRYLVPEHQNTQTWRTCKCCAWRPRLHSYCTAASLDTDHFTSIINPFSGYTSGSNVLQDNSWTFLENIRTNRWWRRTSHQILLLVSLQVFWYLSNVCIATRECGNGAWLVRSYSSYLLLKGSCDTEWMWRTLEMNTTAAAVRLVNQAKRLLTC